MASNSLAVYTPAKQKEIIELMGFKGTPQQTALLFQLAEHYQLDPLIKEVVLIPGKGPFIGVWGRIHIAQRSGMLDGLEMDDEDEDDRHYKVRCVVWHKGQSHPAAKVVGRVGRHEKKDWPWEIARARAVRAALGFAFSIHDAYDHDDDEDWVPAPDERLHASVVAAGPDQEVSTGEPAAAPKKARRVNKNTGEVLDIPPAQPPEVGKPAAKDTASTPRPAPTPGTEPATLLVGGHTLAQKIAIAARNAGIDDDDTRHAIIHTASRGQWGRGTDIPENTPADDPILKRVFDAFTGLADSTVELRFAPNGQALLYRKRAP